MSYSHTYDGIGGDNHCTEPTPSPVPEALEDRIQRLQERAERREWLFHVKDKGVRIGQGRSEKRKVMA